MRVLDHPAMIIAQQYNDLLGSELALGRALKGWQEAEQAQAHCMRKMLDPLADIRQSLLVDNATQRLIKEITEHLKANKHDHMARRGLIQMVGRRKRLLKYLERKNFEAYEATVAKLKLRK